MEGIHSCVTRKTFAKDTDAGHPSAICVQLTIGNRIQTGTSRPSYVDVKPYTGTLQAEGWCVHVAQDGNHSLVDAKGNTPMKSPPAIVCKEGAGHFATYPGSDPNDPASCVDLKPYSAPLHDVYLSKGQDGTLAGVDEKGKPLPRQPAAGTDDGIDYYAYYRTGPGKPPTHTALDSYQPPSSEKPGSA